MLSIKRAYRTLYPLAYRDIIRAEAEAVKLDPALVRPGRVNKKLLLMSCLSV